jgi:protein-S-isoprenylcysteine O-methyltransferase Ste14
VINTLFTVNKPGFDNSIIWGGTIMLLAWIVTMFPVVFLVILFGGGSVFRRRNIDMDGKAPINRTIFVTSKYLIVVLWAAMVIHIWDVNLSFLEIPIIIKSISIALWIMGFSLLFAGRFNMGNSFRIGSPKENTNLKTDGLFKFSRNPMYLGVFTTLLAVVLGTLNPILILIAIFIIAVHHRIVLAEEKYLAGEFGDDYRSYCGRVRRYL